MKPLALLTGIALLCLIVSMAISAVRGREADIGVRGRWSGFGGGRGGWQISSTLTLLFLTVFFGLSYSMLAGYLVYLRNGTDAGKKKTSDAAAEQQMQQTVTCAPAGDAKALTAPTPPKNPTRRPKTSKDTSCPDQSGGN